MVEKKIPKNKVNKQTLKKKKYHVNTSKSSPVLEMLNTNPIATSLWKFKFSCFVNTCRYM